MIRRNIIKTTDMEAKNFAIWAKRNLGNEKFKEQFESLEAFEKSINEDPSFKENVVNFFVNRQEEIYNKYGKENAIKMSIIKTMNRNIEKSLPRVEIIGFTKAALYVFPDDVKKNNYIPSGHGAYDTDISRQINHLIEDGIIYEDEYRNHKTYYKLNKSKAIAWRDYIVSACR